MKRQCLSPLDDREIEDQDKRECVCPLTATVVRDCVWVANNWRQSIRRCWCLLPNRPDWLFESECQGKSCSMPLLPLHRDSS